MPIFALKSYSCPEFAMLCVVNGVHESKIHISVDDIIATPSESILSRPWNELP